MESYSDETLNKVRLYFAANYLYGLGRSYPQVVEELSNFEPNLTLVSEIAEHAKADKWRVVFNRVQQLTAAGKIYQEIVKDVEAMLDDQEIIHFIVHVWYNVQTEFMENYIESGTNIAEGSQWFVIGCIGVFCVFYFGASILAKTIWSLLAISSLITWLYGHSQSKHAGRLNKILTEDFAKFDKMI